MYVSIGRILQLLVFFFISKQWNWPLSTWRCPTLHSSSTSSFILPFSPVESIMNLNAMLLIVKMKKHTNGTHLHCSLLSSITFRSFFIYILRKILMKYMYIFEHICTCSLHVTFLTKIVDSNSPRAYLFSSSHSHTGK